MITLINKVTGWEMRVSEARLDEYLAAGHKLAVGYMPAPEAADAADEKPATPKKRTRKTTK